MFKYEKNRQIYFIFSPCFNYFASTSGTIIRDSYAGYCDLTFETACCRSPYRRRLFEAHEADFYGPRRCSI